MLKNYLISKCKQGFKQINILFWGRLLEQGCLLGFIQYTAYHALLGYDKTCYELKVHVSTEFLSKNKWK